jgi:chlorite dismutase
MIWILKKDLYQIKMSNLEFRKNINKYVEEYNLYVSVVESNKKEQLDKFKEIIINKIIPKNQIEYFKKVINFKK